MIKDLSSIFAMREQKRPSEQNFAQTVGYHTMCATVHVVNSTYPSAQ